MAIRLFTFDQSPPGQAVRLMLEHKGVKFDVVKLQPGLHPALLRVRGFEGATVPALDWEGRKVQGSRTISRFLDEQRPERPLFPADPAARVAVEEAEEWGESLQDLPRHMFRWAAGRDAGVRRWICENAGAPLPGVTARLSGPLARRIARGSGVTEASARAAYASVGERLDRVDALIAGGVIGGTEPNAADFQILTNVRSLMTLEELQPVLAGRPCAERARALLPAMGLRESVRLGL